MTPHDPVWVRTTSGFWFIVCTCGWYTERQTERGAVLAAETHTRRNAQ